MLRQQQQCILKISLSELATILERHWIDYGHIRHVNLTFNFNIGFV